METDIAAVVADGAALLDQLTNNGTVPADWADRIDVRRLDMISSHDCVAGQLWGNFGLAPNVIQVHPAFAGGLDRGFQLPVFEAYRLAWVDFLTP